VNQDRKVLAASSSDRRIDDHGIEALWVEHHVGERERLRIEEFLNLHRPPPARTSQAASPRVCSGESAGNHLVQGAASLFVRTLALTTRRTNRMWPSANSKPRHNARELVANGALLLDVRPRMSSGSTT